MSTKISSKYQQNSAKKSPSYNNHPYEEEDMTVDDLRNDYSQALNYIEALKIEKSNLKNALDLALCDTDTYYTSQKRSFPPSGLTSPKNSDRRMVELEQENKELKDLLETNSKRITQLQKENESCIDRIQKLESLQFENKELVVELDCLNKQFISVSNKLLDAEKRFSTMNSSHAGNNSTIAMGPEKTSIVKYGKYIRKLVESADRNHFTYCCFEERFSKNVDFLSIVQSGDSIGLLLKAFKYITDLLININSYHYANPLPHPRVYPASAGMQPHVQFDDDASFVNEYLPEQNRVRRAESPHDNVPFSSIETANTLPTGRSTVEALKRMRNSPDRHMEKDYVSITEVEPNSNSARKLNNKKEAARRMDNERNNPVMRDHSYSMEEEEDKLGYRGVNNVHDNMGRRTAASEEQKLINRFKELRDKCKELKGGDHPDIEEEEDYRRGENRRNQPADGKQSPFYNEKIAKELNPPRKNSGGILRNANQPNQGQRDVSNPRDRDESFTKTRDPQQLSKTIRKSKDQEKNTPSKLTPRLSPILKSPRDTTDYQPLNSARGTYQDIDDHPAFRSSRKMDNTHSYMSYGTEYPSFTVSFWKTESRGKSGSPSPPPKVSSILDVPQKKRVDAYPPQSYDVIKGKEIYRKKYLDQAGIMESEKVVEKKR